MNDITVACVEVCLLGRGSGGDLARVFRAGSVRVQVLPYKQLQSSLPPLSHMYVCVYGHTKQICASASVSAI